MSSTFLVCAWPLDSEIAPCFALLYLVNALQCRAKFHETHLLTVDHRSQPGADAYILCDSFACTWYDRDFTSFLYIWVKFWNSSVHIFAMFCQRTFNLSEIPCHSFPEYRPSISVQNRQLYSARLVWHPAIRLRVFQPFFFYIISSTFWKSLVLIKDDFFNALQSWTKFHYTHSLIIDLQFQSTVENFTLFDHF